MTTQEYLCRHFARVGARAVVRGPRLGQRTKIAVDIGRDRFGEGFVIGCEEEYERWACEYSTHYTSPFSRLSGCSSKGFSGTEH
jgi:hypothetical protein